MKRIFQLSLLLALGFLLSNCKGIHEDFVMAGEWEVTEVMMNNGNTNFLNSLMPHFSDGNDCCHYRVFYEDGGVMRGEYYTYDTLNYSVSGTWEIVKPGEMYMDTDEYIDGVFTYKKESKGVYKLHSAVNTVDFYNIGLVEMDITSIRN